MMCEIVGPTDSTAVDQEVVSLQLKDTFDIEDTHFTWSTHILQGAHIFYMKDTHFHLRRHILHGGHTWVWRPWLDTAEFLWVLGDEERQGVCAWFRVASSAPLQPTGCVYMCMCVCVCVRAPFVRACTSECMFTCTTCWACWQQQDAFWNCSACTCTQLGMRNVKSTALPVIRSTKSCCEQAFSSTFQSLGANFSFLYMFVIQVVCAKEKKSQSPGLLLARTWYNIYKLWNELKWCVAANAWDSPHRASEPAQTQRDKMLGIRKEVVNTKHIW